MHYTKITAVGVAIVLLGIMSVAAFSPRPHPEAAQPAAAASQPALETFYVPAQHVNKGPAEQPVQEFY
jgi:hypothetical protein